ncbi:MAG: glycosyl hydrolase [Gemmatimonadaceae bacterium]
MRPRFATRTAAASVAIACAAAASARAQWVPQASGTAADFRGLSVVNARVVWVSGSGGTVVRTIDGGATWHADTVPGAAALDFRAVQAFDARVAYVMSAGNGDKSQIYKTTDGGRHWTRQFTNGVAAGFFDAMAFWDRSHGIAMSDPVDGHFMLISTADGGAHWTRLDASSMPAALPNEGGFAASGTCLVSRGSMRAWIGTGGAAVSRVFSTADRGRTWRVDTVPVAAGNASRGIFSIAFADARLGYAVGGDYQQPRGDSANAAVTRDGGRTWTPTATRLHGFRSGAAVMPGTSGRTVIAVGITGTDATSDGGARWTRVDDVEYNGVAFAANGVGWAVGPKGRIARWRK